MDSNDRERVAESKEELLKMVSEQASYVCLFFDTGLSRWDVLGSQDNV